MAEAKGAEAKGLAPQLIAIGASAGGVAAIRLFLSLLPETFQVPIVIVQHLPKGPRLDFNLIYGRNPGRRLIEVEDKMMPQAGDVIMAAPGYHLSLESSGTLALSQEPTVNYSRPSIDVFFESVALSLRSRSAAFLLSGANHDGARGLWAIHRAGGLTVVQDPDEAQNATMPQAALSLFEPDHVLTLERAAELFASLSKPTKGFVFAEPTNDEDENPDRRRP